MTEEAAYLKRIAEHIHKIRAVRGTDRDAFLKSHAIHDHVVMNLIQIGEIARKLPMAFKQKHVAMPWQKMIDFRNKLVHNYDALDLDIVWKITESNLPELEKFVLEQLKEK